MVIGLILPKLGRCVTLWGKWSKTYLGPNWPQPPGGGRPRSGSGGLCSLIGAFLGKLKKGKLWSTPD